MRAVAVAEKMGGYATLPELPECRRRLLCTQEGAAAPASSSNIGGTAAATAAAAAANEMADIDRRLLV